MTDPSTLEPQKIRLGIEILLGGGFLAYISLRALNIYRAKRILPVSKIRSLAVGPVHLLGNLISDSKLTASITGEKGVLIVSEIEVLKSRRLWTPIFSTGLWDKLFIKDETGTIEVDPPLFQYFLNPVFKYQSFSKVKKSNTLDAFLKKADFCPHVSFLGIRIPKIYRVREYVIKNGYPIEIFGYASIQSKKDGLTVTSTEKKTLIFQEVGHKDFPYKSLFLLITGGALVGVGISTIVFATQSVSSSVHGLLIWVIVVLLTLFVSLHYILK